MKIPIYQIDAFAERPFEGNPAAVCPLTEWLPDDVLQSIAEENNLSETAFLVGGDGHYHLRWFTPRKEVELCGHATLAAARVLFDSSCRNRREITFETRSGDLAVMRDGDLLTMDFPAQPGEACDVPAPLREALGGAPESCWRAADYMVVLRDEEAVVSVDPDLRRLLELDLRGVIVTARGNACDFVSRFFAPRFGVDEDPVTGSAHCMLAPYWAGVLGKLTMTARQLSKRTGVLECRVAGERVWISGRTVAYLEGQIEVAGH